MVDIRTQLGRDFLGDSVPLNVPRYESASALFAVHSVNNLVALMRINMFSFVNRLTTSSNSIISAVSNGYWKMHSNIWSHFSIKLGGNDVVLYW